MGILLQGLGFAQGWGDSGQELRRREPMDILIVQSLDHLVSRQIQKGFQERLAEEEGWGFRFMTYDVKGKFANSRVLAQLLSRKEADLVLAIGASAAQTAILASKLKTQITTDRGENEELMKALPRSENPAADTQASVIQTATLASRLKGQIMAKDGSEAVASQVNSPEREEVNTQASAALRPMPIVFTAVVDPFYIHILPKNGPLGPVYGVLDPPPIQDQLRLIRLVMPGLERLGVVYSEDAVAVVKLVEDLKEMAPVFGIEVLAVPIRSLEGVAGAYTALAPEVEAFFMPLDDRLLVQVDLILALANQYFLPVFASDTASVERGALAGLGYNYHEAGRMAAELALRALDTASEGDQPKGQDLPRLVQQKQRLTLNQKTARRLRIVFPASALREADSLLD